jgi:DNA-binding transcriptional regulator YdaS (Cro superfamily)
MPKKPTRATDDDVQAGHAELRRAIMLCGSRTELARRISVYRSCSPARIQQWQTRHKPVPPEFAPFISAAVSGRVTVESLCPDYEGWMLLREQFEIQDLDREKADA